MLMRWQGRRDPWWDDGQGARKLRTRQKVVGSLAFSVAIVACGLTAAAWVQALTPLWTSLGVPLG